MTRIVQFAVATSMRLDEICRVEWRDLDAERRMLLIRERKDPRNKTGNDQRIPLFDATGFDAGPWLWRKRKTRQGKPVARQALPKKATIEQKHAPFLMFWRKIGVFCSKRLWP